MLGLSRLALVGMLLAPLALIAALAAAFYLDFFASPWAGPSFGALSVAVAVLGGVILYAVVRRLESAAHRLSLIVESAADAILSTDRYGYIEAANPAAVALFGYRPGELGGSRVTVLFPSSYRESDPDAILDTFLRENDMDASGRAFEVTGVRRNGDSFYMDFSVTPAVLGSRDVYTVVMRDVSHRVKARIALQRARDELEERVRARTRDLEDMNERLGDEIQERKKTQAERERLIEELQDALAKIKTLRGLLPICAHCKKVRDDSGYWNQIEDYVRAHSEADFSHGLCPDCITELYPELQNAGDGVEP